jgi:hypothetical protein
LTRQTTDGPAGRKLAECFLSSVPAAPPFALVIDVMYNGEQQLLHNAAAAATAAAHKHSIPPLSLAIFDGAQRRHHHSLCAKCSSRCSARRMRSSSSPAGLLYMAILFSPPPPNTLRSVHTATGWLAGWPTAITEAFLARRAHRAYNRSTNSSCHWCVCGRLREVEGGG